MRDLTPQSPGGGTSVIATSKVVSTVFDRILDAIHDGTLVPGQHISDAQMAEQFGVSRTPVREAIQRLREIGVIEASPGRFTRIARVTPEQTEQAYQVWLALYAVLVDEVIEHASVRALGAMTKDSEEFGSAVRTRDVPMLARTNLDFFGRLLPESKNPALQRAINSVVHLVRLGGMHLPEFVDLDAILRAQAMLLEAVRTRDVETGHAAMVALGAIAIPHTAAARDLPHS